MFVRIQQRAEGHKPPINFCATSMATLGHVVENHLTIITQQLPSTSIFFLQLFLLKGNGATEKGQLNSFIVSCLLLNTEENKSFGRVRLIAILKSLQPLETLHSYTLP